MAPGWGRRAFAEALLPPFAGRHSETFLEHHVEQAEVLVAAVVGDVDDFGVRVREQLAGVLEAQFNLARAERHAEFLAEQAGKMAFAAIELPGQVAERALGEFGLRHPADQLPETFEEFAAAGGFPYRRGQQIGDGVGPQLEQPATHRQALLVRLFRQPRESLGQRLGSGED